MSITAKTEKDNFSRLGQGIVGTGNTMARDLLTSYISPTDLIARVLPSGRPPHTVLKRLNKGQEEHIKNAGVDGYAKFDISLVYVLLRNVCTNLSSPTKPNIPDPTQGWGKDPTASDLTPSDDMERLRILRNTVYGHVSKASIPDTEYQIHWQELRDIANRMKIQLGKDYLKELQEAEIYKMTDADLKQMIDEIKKGKDEVIKRAKKIAKGHKKEIKEIKEHLEDIVKEGNTETKEHTKNILQEESRGIKHHTTETVQNQNREIKQHITEQGRKIIEYITGTVQDNKQSIEQLDRRLLEINDAMTKHTPLAPLEEDGDTMPVDLLYASVVITEDVKCPPGSTASSSQTQRKVSTPADLFERDGIRAKRIFLKGDAAHGKTTYCLWLVRKWCDTKGKIGEGGEHLDQRQETMGGFDFVFLIQFRNVNPNRSSIMDMICYDLFGMDKGCHDAIRHVLSSDDYRSLIIMDGLDEWNPNEEARKNLTCKHMPNIEGLSNSVVCFFSMRTWLFPKVSRMKGDRFKVLIIHGLSEAAVEKVVQKVLLNHYNLKKDTVEFEETNSRIIKIVHNSYLKSFMKIPLLAVVCVQLCYDGENIGNSLTMFYASMLNMLIERAQLQHESTKHMSCQTTSVTFPKILSTKRSIMNVSSVIIKLGKIAYEGLISNQRQLVFQESDLKSELGEKELKFALDVGLMSQSEARSLTTRNCSVTFLHKSVQEFLAAVFHISHNDITGKSFCEALSSIDIVMHCSNIIMFICGLSPSLGSSLSQHVANLTNTDIEISSYRISEEIIDRLPFPCSNQENENPMIRHYNKVEALFEIQAIWFREIQFGENDDKKAGRQVLFQVSDVYYAEYHNFERLKLTNYLLTENFDEIKSLHLLELIKRNDFLKTSSSLLSRMQNLYILELFEMNHGDIKPEDSPLLTGLPNLHILKLSNVKFGNICLENTPLMTNMPMLETLVLFKVTVHGIRLTNCPLFTNLPNLNKIKLHESSIGFINNGDVPLLTNLPKMHTIQVRDLTVQCRAFGNTPLLRNMPNLHYFEVSNVFLEGLVSPVYNSFEITPCVTNMPNLHTIRVRGVSLCGFNLQNTAHLRNISNLSELNISDVKVGDIDLEHTPLLTNMPNLVSVVLKDINFGEITLGNTPLLTNMPNLESLVLQKIKIDRITLENAPLLTRMPKLRKIVLIGVTMYNLELKNTPLLTNLPKLRTLEFGVYILTMSSENAPLFTDLHNLHTLELSGYLWWDLVNPLLKNMPKLVTLSIDGFNFDFEGPGQDHITLLSNIPNIQFVNFDFRNVFWTIPWISADMLQLQKVEIKYNELLTSEGWKELIDALEGINYSFEVILVDVDKTVKTFICQSPYFRIEKSNLRYTVRYVQRYAGRYIGRYIYLRRPIKRSKNSFNYRDVKTYCENAAFWTETSDITCILHHLDNESQSVTPQAKMRTTHGKTRGMFGRNVDRYVGKAVKCFKLRIRYSLTIKRVCP